GETIMKVVHESKTMSSQWIKQAEPILSEMLSSWHLIPVEGDDYASKVLEFTCGIDYLLICEGTPNVYGVASRIQSGKNYRTCTVPK
ncbi:MAG: hypothetical protein IJP54_04005, partial [Synergistaceae bacterium]|nr:hypothetical protein [Synergistaceae bacterium]